MDENTIIILILAVMVLLELAGGVVLYRYWDHLWHWKYGVRLPICAALILSALIPPLVLWCIAFTGYLLNVKQMWRLWTSISGATENIIMVYGFAVEGSSRTLWGSLFVIAVLGWIVSTVTRRKKLFLASQMLTIATFSLPPILLLLGAIPYVGE